jgi:hypothetical protein
VHFPTRNEAENDERFSAGWKGKEPTQKIENP